MSGDRLDDLIVRITQAVMLACMCSCMVAGTVAFVRWALSVTA